MDVQDANYTESLQKLKTTRVDNLICAKHSASLYSSKIYLWPLDWSDLQHVQIITTLPYIRASFEHLIGHKNTFGASSGSLLIKWLYRCC